MSEDKKEPWQVEMAARREKLQKFMLGQQQRQEDGLEALFRLFDIANGNSGQCKIVANFLLSCYNGYRFKFDLTDFRSLDLEIFEDCLLVLKMDYQPIREVHTYFTNGNEVFEKLAKDWKITDYTIAK